MALALIVIPVVVRTTENMLRLVPNSLREAAAALGAPQWKVILGVTLRASKAGVLTGILLAVARISGETARCCSPRSTTVLEFGHERADGQPADRDLPVRHEPVRRLAHAGLGRLVADHLQRPCPQHPRPCWAAKTPTTSLTGYSRP